MLQKNPGPDADSDSPTALSIIHLNIRSIRNKLDFIKDNFSDLDILCSQKPICQTLLIMMIYVLKSLILHTERTFRPILLEILFTFHKAYLVLENQSWRPT